MNIEKALEVFGAINKVLISEIISVVRLVLLLAPQVPQLNCIDQVKDLSTVSGFYGPGPYIAWILAFTSTLASYEMNLSAFKSFRRIFQWHQRPETDEAVDIQPSPIDGNFIAGVAFPLAACIDFIERRRAGILDGQFDAAACVAHTSMLFTFVAFRGSLFQYRVRKLGNYNFTILAGIRFLALCTLWVISITIVYSHAFSRRYPYMHIQMLFACTATFFTMCAIAAPSFTHTWSVGSVVYFCLALALYQYNYWREHPCVLRVQFPFPQTASKLGDLDQAAALATGLAVFMYPILKATTRMIWRLLGTPQNPPNTNQPTLPH